MKAAVLFNGKDIPQYITDHPEPELSGDNQVLIKIKAAAIKHLDRSRASGKHYSTGGERQQATVLGGDGVGTLEDGTRVYALGVTGMAAEKAVAEKSRIIPVPAGLDDVTAAALPNAVIGSAMALLFRAGMQGGETVLINGATGFTGKVAIQVARLYGAKHIIATGRDAVVLETLRQLGADEVVSFQDSGDKIIAQLKDIHQRTPVGIIVDYLWGQPAEWLLQAFKGDGSFSVPTQFVSVGSMAGDAIQLSSAILRSVDLRLSGSGLGSWSREEVQRLFKEIIPAMFDHAANRKLKADTVELKLEEIEKVWDTAVEKGKRLVVTI
jgi:NADPH:quinone reductase-like Zn-dependent oxidoreductase